MVRKVTKRLPAIGQVGRKARQLNPAIASQFEMVQINLLVPPKHPKIGQHFEMQVAERSKPQPRRVSVLRSGRRTAVVCPLQVSLAIALPFATQADVNWISIQQWNSNDLSGRLRAFVGIS